MLDDDRVAEVILFPCEDDESPLHGPHLFSETCFKHDPLTVRFEILHHLARGRHGDRRLFLRLLFPRIRKQGQGFSELVLVPRRDRGELKVVFHRLMHHGPRLFKGRARAFEHDRCQEDQDPGSKHLQQKGFLFEEGMSIGWWSPFE